MQDIKKDYSEMNFQEFNNAVDEDSNLILVFFAKGDQVWKDLETNRYFYLETGINDASTFYELEQIASLMHSHHVNILYDPETVLCLFGGHEFIIQEADENSTKYVWLRRRGV